MKDSEKKKLRGILDGIRFDGKPVEHALSQIESMFDRSELREKHKREETRGFYVFSIVLVIGLTVIVASCYHSV